MSGPPFRGLVAAELLADKANAWGKDAGVSERASSSARVVLGAIVVLKLLLAAPEPPFSGRLGLTVGRFSERRPGAPNPPSPAKEDLALKGAPAPFAVCGCWLRSAYESCVFGNEADGWPVLLSLILSLSLHILSPFKNKGLQRVV